MKKSPPKLRTVRTNTTTKQWNLYRNIGRQLEQMNRLPDAASAVANPPKASPVSLLPLLF